MKSAASEPPKPNPTSTFIAFSPKIRKMMVAPSSPRPTVTIPETPPALKASSIASLKLVRAAFALRTLPLTASHIPTKPAL